MNERFNICIIGAGPGGYVAAIRAAQLGFRTALVDRRSVPGGTCLNIGCIPSKALLHVTEHFDFMRNRASSMGILADNVHFDLSLVQGYKSEVVSRLTKGVAGLLRDNGVVFYCGEASLPESGTVRVASTSTSEILKADHIILATGSEGRVLPDVPVDGHRVAGSTEALSFDSVPETLAVIGAGAIGLELGSVWNRLGSQVHVLEIMPQILPGWDSQTAKSLQTALKKEGISFYLGSSLNSVKRGGDKALISFVDNKKKTVELEADKVLVAAGRVPHISISAAGRQPLALTERGAISIDENFKTSIDGIYAIGDAVSGPMLAHKAEEEGIALVERLAGLPGLISHDLVPGVVYTSPEAACVGLTEDVLKAQKREYRKGTFSFGGNSRAVAAGLAAGQVKVLADKKTDRIIGVHIMGPGASEMITEAVSVMEFGGSSEDIARTIHAHPTLSEALKEASLGVDGRAIHAVNRKKMR